MPVYNSERYLKEAIESILHQTLQDFEFIIVADKSTDGTDAIINRYQQKDNRIKVYHQERMGLVASLNKGCSLAKGKYIARMDADDISLPQRLDRQVQYMESHPEVGILGTWSRSINEMGEPGKSECPLTNPKLIGFYLYFCNCVSHPSVMMRRDILESIGSYSPEAPHAEDYELWTRATSITQISILPEILLEYRNWKGSISKSNSKLQGHAVIEIRRSMISKLLGPDISADIIVATPDLSNSSIIGIVQYVSQVASLMCRLYVAYIRSNSLSRMEALEAGHISINFFIGIVKDILLK